MKVISSMATRHVLADLTAAAASAGLPPVEVESVGGVDAARRVAASEPFDLVILADGALARLAAEGHVDAATLTPLVRSQVAVAVPSGSDDPAVATDRTAFADADGMRAALRDATRIGYSTGPSGTALVQMIADWHLTDELGGRLAQAPSGIPVARMIAGGTIDLGFQQLSELVGQPGVRILGVLPPDCAIDTVFAGSVATTSSDAAAAAGILAFLASPDAASITAAHTFGAP